MFLAIPRDHLGAGVQEAKSTRAERFTKATPKEIRSRVSEAIQ